MHYHVGPNAAGRGDIRLTRFIGGANDRMSFRRFSKRARRAHKRNLPNGAARGFQRYPLIISHSTMRDNPQSLSDRLFFRLTSSSHTFSCPISFRTSSTMRTHSASVGMKPLALKKLSLIESRAASRLPPFGPFSFGFIIFRSSVRSSGSSLEKRLFVFPAREQSRTYRTGQACAFPQELRPKDPVSPPATNTLLYLY